jgi:glycine/D-amino acid oxidase-like deaminating enzyme
MFFYGELDTYIIPSFDGIVTLGGSRNFDCEKMEICPYEGAAIRERCIKLVPSLATAEIIRQEIGLRPHREGGVKVGGEIITNDGAKSIVSIW